MAIETKKQSDALLELLTKTTEDLITVVAGKAMVPLDVFKWLVIFMILVQMSREFGKEDFKTLFQELKPLFQAEAAESPPEPPVIVGE